MFLATYHTAQGETDMTRIKMIVIGVLALLVLIVILQNTATVETKILFVTLTMPRAVLLIGTTLVGFVVGLLASYRITKQSDKR
jgi:putative membrane protein